MKNRTTVGNENENAVMPEEAPPITDIREMLEAMAKPLHAQFRLDGRLVKLEVKRADRAVHELRRNIIRAVQPPFRPEMKDYDHLNADYLKRRDRAEEEARAVTVYHCCPGIAALKPGLIKPGDMLDLLAPIPDHVRELIELTALAAGLDLEVNRVANFTSAGPSEN